MKLVNLTPHAITLFTPEGVKKLPASGKLARVRADFRTVGGVEGIALVRQQFGPVEGLPDPQPDTRYIVSSLVMNALSALGITRPDVIAPGTGPNNGAIRDAQGRVRGITQFICQ